MKGSPFQKLVLMSLLLACGIALLMHFFLPRPAARTLTPKVAAAPPEYHYTPPTPQVNTSAAVADTHADSDKPASVLTKEQIEAWLLHHNRDARSLLAAFRSSHDTNYLNEAAAKFPNDPGVELSVLAHDEFPGDRRKWLDLFKNSSPSNSLANYLSAQDYFKSGQSDLAVQELLSASAKNQFDNHAMGNLLDAEELYKESGSPELAAPSYAMADMSDENMPELSTFKQLDQAMAELMKQKAAAGDSASAVNVAQMGLQLANNLKAGDTGKFVINGMVANATENIMLSQLDPNTPYDILNGQTPAQVQAQLKADKAAFRQLNAEFQPIMIGMYQNPAEFNDYMQRTLIYGETAAMQWAVQQHSPSPATPGQ
jgi:hypothetical protein